MATPKTKQARKVALCQKCKGFEVPARRVAAVARDSRGRFQSPGRSAAGMRAGR